MCEYCGCQQISVVDELTREHDAVVALLGPLREGLAAGRLDDVADSCRQVRAVLGPHTVVEEEGLFPLLAGEYPSHVTALRAEHREIEAVLAEAADGVPTDPSWPGRLQRSMFMLREHILKEQDGVFPAALSSLDGEQWESVERVRARAGRYPLRSQ
jgi:hemerythrin-like domain-containing protein